MSKGTKEYWLGNIEFNVFDNHRPMIVKSWPALENKEKITVRPLLKRWPSGHYSPITEFQYQMPTYLVDKGN